MQAIECSCCRERFETGCIPYHSEEYGPTVEDYWATCVPLCHRCHAMLHARFRTPNRWRRYLSQAADGNIDRSEYPQSKYIAALLSKFKNREDTSYWPMPDHVPEYFLALRMNEYAGAQKVATLLVADLHTGCEVEVPDWTLYGTSLERLEEADRRSLIERGVDVAGFLARAIKLPLNAAGIPVYRRLYG